MGIFGGGKSHNESQQTSSSQSSSGNQAYPWLQQTYSPTVDTGNTAMDHIKALLGLGGDAAGANSAYHDYLGSTAYNSQLQTGSNAITGNNAAKGLLGSGDTLKRLQTFGSNLGQTYFGNYLQQLLGTSQAGQSAAGLISGAGQQSSSSSQSQGTSVGDAKQNPDLSKLLGSLISGGGGAGAAG